MPLFRFLLYLYNREKCIIYFLFLFLFPFFFSFSFSFFFFSIKANCLNIYVIYGLFLFVFYKFIIWYYSHLTYCGGILTKSVSKSSINCSFKSLTFGPAYLLYSSNIEVKFQRWSFLKQPITVPIYIHHYIIYIKIFYKILWC